MNSAWSLELARLIALVTSTVLLGLVSDQWILSITLHALMYIFWINHQVKQFERWIVRGAHKSDAPDSSGIWQSMVQHMYRSQQSHKSRKKQLASMANYYHAVMRALPDATIVINKDYEIEWANKASQKLLGVKPNKDLGQKLNNIIRVPEIETLLDKKTKVKRVEFKSPTTPDITLSVFRQEYEKGNYLIIAHDISHRIATQKLRKAFIANASHELRTPLTVISGYLEILLDDEDTQPGLKSILSNAFDQANRMDNILDNLLVLSKLEEKRYSKDTGDDVDVRELLERMVADFRVSYAETKHTFKVEAVDLQLRVIENEFYSICQNLVSNAVKYSTPGSEIQISWTVNEAGYGCLSIRDQGEGIEDEHLSRLTERFYRVNHSGRQVQGTGLGLSIVKHILDNHDGYLDIESEVGNGSEFKACFPGYRLISDD